MLLRKLTVLSAFLVLSGAVGPLTAQSDPKTDLEQKLKQAFPLTTFSPDRSAVVTAGAVVVLQKDKMMTYAVASPMPPVNTYKNGKIGQGMGGFGRDLLITTMASGAATANDYPHQTFNTGQLLWVAQISVANDHITFVLWSDPDDNDIRYYGQLNIPFHKGAIPSADEALNTISEVLKLQPAGDNSAEQQPPPAPIPPPAPVQQTFIPPPPPPPPADTPPAPPKTISLGQTKDQVIAIFGPPQKIVQLGSKEIDYYPDLKVTYLGGKVSDVQ